MQKLYLWQKGYLTGDKRLYSPVSVSYLSWSAMMGISMIYLIDFLMSHLTFLPDWLSDTFDLFTRPRRFGKTLNMSMLKNFFEIGTDRSLFDGLHICANAVFN